jgi:ubiquinone/menaquinone biosynthesis C-methylase UbiE
MALPAYAMNQSNFPEMYERLLVGPLFRPWAEAMLDEVALRPGDSLLDIACGTGIVARLAQDRQGGQGRVVGVDVSSPMLAVAKAAAPGVEWREGNATALPLAEGEQFDVVTCQQGLQFFPDRAAAASQIRRALAPGGRFALATWRPLEENPLFFELHRIGERHLGPIVDQRHAFGETAPLETLLRGAGLNDAAVKTVSRIVRFDDAAALINLNAMALVGMSAAAKDLDPEARGRAVAAIVSDSVEAVAPYTDANGLAFEMSTNVATGRG